MTTTYENGEPVPATYAKSVAVAGALYKGYDKAEVLAVWAKVARDDDEGEEAREYIADVTDGEIEVIV